MNAHVKNNEFSVQASRLPEEVESLATQVAGDFEVPELEALLLPELSEIESEEEAEFLTNMLVVDDLPVNRKLIGVQLKRLGFEVDHAENGQAAFDLVAKQEYAIVFMDLEMPVLDGYQASIAIRQLDLDRAQHTTIVGMSSSLKEAERQKCINSGMDNYIQKGVSARQLEELIKTYPRKKNRPALSQPEKKTNDAGISIDFELLQGAHGPYEAEVLIDISIGSMKTLLGCLICALEEKHTANLLHFAEAMVAPCKMLGLNSMTRLVARISADAEGGDWQSATEGVQLFQSQYNQILDQITGHIASIHRTDSE